MSRPIQPVLYVEDDDNDVFLMKRAFRRLAIAMPLEVVSDGKLAIAYLSGTGPYQDRERYPVPRVVLLDLSLPGRHGLDVLQWIRHEAGLAGVPVVVLSSSNQQRDVQRAYLLGADGYLLKPGDPDELLRIVRRVQGYWLVEDRPVGTFVEFAADVVVPPPAVQGP
ncbi:MAG: response regulator [Myxococcota bacterium]